MLVRVTHEELLSSVRMRLASELLVLLVFKDDVLVEDYFDIFVFFLLFDCLDHFETRVLVDFWP